MKRVALPEFGTSINHASCANASPFTTRCAQLRENFMTQLHNIQLEQFINQPPARVWQALTDPALLAQWWAAGDVRPVIGHRFTLDLGAPFGHQPCEVLAVDNERLFFYTFASGTLNTTITWRLQPEGSGTRLFLEQAGVDLDSPLGKMAFNGMGAGWPNILARIGPLLSASGKA
jgi:uncharacterized protein YndB with AHSA1/START domain